MVDLVAEIVVAASFALKQEMVQASWLEREGYGGWI